MAQMIRMPADQTVEDTVPKRLGDPQEREWLFRELPSTTKTHHPCRFPVISRSLEIQIAQSRECSYALGPKVGISCIHRSSGYRALIRLSRLRFLRRYMVQCTAGASTIADVMVPYSLYS